MAGASEALSESGAEEGDYESDSDGTSTLALRRRAGSDDEEELRHGDQRAVEGAGSHRTQDAASSVDGEGSRMPYSDEEEDDLEEETDGDDGVGAAPLYEDEEELLDDEVDGRNTSSRELLSRRRKGSDDDDEEYDDVADGHDLEDGSVGGSKRGDSPERVEGSAREGAKEGNEEEKKEAEPFVVPTAGAFYMHDDRFRESGGARPRRGLGGRKLWEAKDEKPWVHDLFEELNLGRDVVTGEGYLRGGRSRGRGRGRGRSRGRGGGNRLSSYEDGGGMRSRNYGRGRGQREAVKEEASTTAKYNSSSPAAAIEVNQDMSAQSGSNQDDAPAKRSSGGSHLSSASPPFIPSGVLQQKLAGRAETTGDGKGNQGATQGRVREQYGPGGKNGSGRAVSEFGVGSRGFGGAGRGVNSGSQGAGTVWKQSDNSSPSTTSQQPPMLTSNSARFESKAQNSSGASKTQAAAPSGQYGRGSASQNQAAGFVTTTYTQDQSQPMHGQQAGVNAISSQQHASSGSVGTTNNARYKGNGGGRGAPPAGTMPVTGRAPYMFPGAPNLGPRVGDPSFQPAPPVAPVAVPYGAQGPAGMGVPAVGMIPNFPYGFPNSEVTWVPVLAGGGAMGGGYGAPYIPMEGAPSHMYYTSAAAPQPGQTYHLPGRDINGAKNQPLGGLWKPPPSPELGTDDYGQRQSKPRRYSEMSFGQ